MNYENLHKLIDRYEENIYYLNNETNDEKFKWHAVQQFQDAWFAPESQNMPFSEMFNRAQKASAVLVNNSTVQPANGIVKVPAPPQSGSSTVAKRFTNAGMVSDCSLPST